MDQQKEKVMPQVLTYIIDPIFLQVILSEISGALQAHCIRYKDFDFISGTSELEVRLLATDAEVKAINTYIINTYDFIGN